MNTLDNLSLEQRMTMEESVFVWAAYIQRTNNNQRTTSENNLNILPINGIFQTED